MTVDIEAVHTALNQRLEPITAELKALLATVTEHVKWIALSDGIGTAGTADMCKSHKQKLEELEDVVKSHQTFIDKLKGSTSGKFATVQMIAMLATSLLATTAIVMQALALNGN